MVSALRSSSREIVNMPVPEDIPWSDAVLAIQAAVAVDSDFSYGTGMQAQILKEIRDLEGRVRELYNVEVRVWSALETIEDVAALRGVREIVGSLREAAMELDKATEAMSEWLYRLTEGVNQLVLTVARMRKEVIDEFTASARKRPSTSAKSD
ncbi:hypothetical protein ACJRO7_004707 [Eucalyptus globulus]|uniref:Uncharacterized protein n=1 Tax=Eucalyptus globulus TaxID=34317 RepID=A0ABD3J298_EUCGL